MHLLIVILVVVLILALIGGNTSYGLRGGQPFYGFGLYGGGGIGLILIIILVLFLVGRI